MKRTMITWMMAGMLLATTAAACGSDEDESPTTEASGDETETEATEAAGDETGGNAEVETFCSEAEELAAELKKVMADPTSGDVATLTAKAQEFATNAATLAASVAGDAAASQRLTECSTAISTALTGG